MPFASHIWSACFAWNSAGSPRPRRCVHPRALPLAAHNVHCRADLAPVVARCVRHVDHPEVVVGCAARVLEQSPNTVEERSCEAGLHVGIERDRVLIHDVAASFQESRVGEAAR